MILFIETYECLCTFLCEIDIWKIFTPQKGLMPQKKKKVPQFSLAKIGEEL